MQYKGRCHCGSIGFFYRTERPPKDWSIRACQCSFCRAHGARTTSDPAGSVEYFADRPDQLQRYRFGLNVTAFLICKTCGVYVGAVTEVSAALLTIINSNALYPLPADIPEAVPVIYDGESVDARNRRRQRAWTPFHGMVGEWTPPSPANDRLT